MAKVDAWDTEDGTPVVWGTHDPVEAYDAFVAYATEIHGSEPDADLLPTAGEWETASKYWGSPELAKLEEEIWPEELFSRFHIEGWIPYLVY